MTFPEKKIIKKKKIRLYQCQRHYTKSSPFCPLFSRRNSAWCVCICAIHRYSGLIYSGIFSLSSSFVVEMLSLIELNYLAGCLLVWYVVLEREEAEWGPNVSWLIRLTSRLLKRQPEAALPLPRHSLHSLGWTQRWFGTVEGWSFLYFISSSATAFLLYDIGQFLNFFGNRDDFSFSQESGIVYWV